MKRIIVNGKTYKSSRSVLKDKVAMLHYGFVIAGFISADEWARSQQLIVEKFNLKITESHLDGRTKEAKGIPYFSWRKIIDNLQFVIK